MHLLLKLEIFLGTGTEVVLAKSPQSGLAVDVLFRVLRSSAARVNSCF